MRIALIVCVLAAGCSSAPQKPVDTLQAIRAAALSVCRDIEAIDAVAPKPEPKP